ncbi:LicD family protein [Arthrobacter sp. MPF02]|uniref:LicD family protein n=1 Tax=Arthrobacter sp. MPF02 TaxID=3388492 RepID=UPI003984CCA2
MTQDLETQGTAAGSTHSISADRSALTLDGPPVPADATLSVLLNGRRIWSLRAGDHLMADRGGRWTVTWPPALAGRLTGWAELTVLQDGSALAPAAAVAFDASPARFSLEEPGTGMPQIVNKWGRIARNFEGQRSHLVDEALDEACALVDWARGYGLELFVTGGTLLGPVRDGRIMPGDDDVDLAYLSRHQNPSDVVLEGFALERALHGQGYETVRHSAGHLQLLFPGEAGTDRFYLDIFTYFNAGGWFHGTFHARERSEKVPILPLRTLAINGRTLPAPADPEAMLAAIYGPGWSTPDPAFRFVTPPAARRRYDTWLGNLDGDRENWEDHHRTLLAQGQPGRSSPWAQQLARELPNGSRILELGSGLGADARHLAGQGHHVVAVDYSRPAIEFLHSFRADTGGSLRAERVNLNNPREVVPLARLANDGGGPLHVYARLLLDSLSEQGQENALTLLGHLLRNQRAPAAAYLEFAAEPAPPPFPGCRFHHDVSPLVLEQALADLGLEAVNVPPLTPRPEEGAAKTCRLRVRALP